MNSDVINDLIEKTSFKKYQIENVLELLDNGATIPFIARYRKEKTGNLNEDDLRLIETSYNYFLNLKNRKEDVIRLINEKNMLTPEIEESIMQAKKLSEVEDIYLPFKEKRKTKGTEAIKMGLEGLSKELLKFSNKTKEEMATPYLNDQVKTIDQAITNAGYIIADKISDNIKYRKWCFNYMWYNAFITGKKKKDSVDDKKLYEIYYQFEEKVTRVKPHQILALNRASKEKIITYSIKVDDHVITDHLINEVIGNKNFITRPDVESFIIDGYKRLIKPSIERDIKNELFDNASNIAIKEFGSNLESLLLTPPIKECVVMGFDPAFRTGCKLAILNPTGEVLDIGVIYPNMPKNDIEGSTKVMLDFIKKYDVKVIAIGNGTASRESEAFVANLIKENNLDVKFIIVSEAGASVYSASPLAKKEFPTYSVEQRSAVSIARRLQDSLSELVKIDPKSIGVGLYQHDLKASDLDDELSFTVSKVVNKVGVNLNNASESILNYVSGLSKSLVKKIINYKKKKRFNNREDLKQVDGMDSHAFEQSAGFLRIIGGDNPLDKTNIHPEDYDIVENILNSYNISSNDVGKKIIEEKLNNINDIDITNKFNISRDKWHSIKDNLIHGVIDPRENIPQVKLRSDILSLDDLEIGMALEGTVRNVTSFGAFVDIGLHDDALIHISKMSKSFVKHPSDILQTGDIITAYVSEIDYDKKRVSLSLI